MTEPLPEYLTAEQVKQLVPDLPKNAQMVLIGERIYKREDGKWRCLGRYAPTGIES